MCFGGGSSTPKVAAAPPAPAAASADAKEVTAARDREKSRRYASEGKASTMITGALGDTSTASTSAKTLLGA